VYPIDSNNLGAKRGLYNTRFAGSFTISSFSDSAGNYLSNVNSRLDDPVYGAFEIA